MTHTTAKPKILAVDDRPANLLAMRTILAKTDADVLTAVGGNDALALCLEHDFAVILLDVDMPGMDGYELAELLRGEPKTAQVPLIFVTASYSDELHRKRGYSVGAVEYIQKPVDDFILRSKVNIFLDLYLSRRSLELELARSEAMASILRENEARLRAGEQKFRNLVENISDLIWETDGNGCFTYVSPRCLDLLKCTPDSLKGRYLADLCRPNDADRVKAAMAEGVQRLELTLRLPGAEEIETEISLSPIMDGAGSVVGHRGITRDITTRKKVRAQLAQKTAELERSNADLEQFAYVASHDLREPLRMVSSFLGLLERRIADRLDEESREYIAFAKDGAQRMDRLIRDLLDYSRIGRTALPDTPISLENPLESALGNLTVAIEESGAEIIRDTTMPSLRVDGGEFVRLFQNLVANAIKYRHPDRAPRITLSAMRSKGQWEFTIQDNGMGIEPQFSERIFQIFQRLQGRNETEGTGIGLAVCKRVVGRYGGRIWVESVPGQGSCFRFTLPDPYGVDGDTSV
ncbi:hypothetical protein A6A04_00595 [Paramagnetospirillum marisnigri]|uniref:histidine kinase n=1 Tax=Paramagnetospirillum marisnigri TaxID=1285242 RepID=A0A178MRV1_9PROT|nr:ATP-binding protein [Paramagnetospirillum marisnigri]OAN52229.1 hypothetical protein A6A04_00595 [Paramagnetospirillum marisnigri]